MQLLLVVLLSQESVLEFYLQTLWDVRLSNFEICFSVERIIDLIFIEEIFETCCSLRLHLCAEFVLLSLVTKDLVCLVELLSIDFLQASRWNIFFILQALALDFLFRLSLRRLCFDLGLICLHCGVNDHLFNQLTFDLG